MVWIDLTCFNHPFGGAGFATIHSRIDILFIFSFYLFMFSIPSDKLTVRYGKKSLRGKSTISIFSMANRNKLPEGISYPILNDYIPSGKLT